MEQLNKNCEDIKIEKMLENINESDNRNVIKNKKINKKIKNLKIKLNYNK